MYDRSLAEYRKIQPIVPDKFIVVDSSIPDDYINKHMGVPIELISSPERERNKAAWHERKQSFICRMCLGIGSYQQTKRDYRMPLCDEETCPHALERVVYEERDKGRSIDFLRRRIKMFTSYVRHGMRPPGDIDNLVEEKMREEKEYKALTLF